MPQFRITSPEGKTYNITAPEGATREDALARLESQLGGGQSLAQQRYAAEDAATEKENRNDNFFQNLGTGIKAQSGRVVLGGLELANNLTGDSLIDPEVLATAQRGADTMDKGTGVGGAVGNLVGDVRNLAPIGRGMSLAKAGAVSGGLTGLTEGTGNEKSNISDNLANATIGATGGAVVGKALPMAAKPVISTANAVGRGADRVAAGLGSDTAASRVAYRNLAKALKDQGFHPGEIASQLDEFKAQGIDGGTLGEMLQASGLLSREKDLLRGDDKAARYVQDRLSGRKEAIQQNVVNKADELVQPEQTTYLYEQAAKNADTATTAINDGAVTNLPQSASQKELPFTVNAIKEDIAERLGAETGKIASALERVQNVIIQRAENNGLGFEAVDDAKKMLSKMYVEGAQDYEQQTINEIVDGYRKMLNESLEQAGGETYQFAKKSSMRDMAGREVKDAINSSQGVKVALNKIAGSPEQKAEFLRKLPDDATRNQWESYLNNIEKITGKPGGSDTYGNQVSGAKMATETGLGFDTNIANPKTVLNRLADPIQRKVRLEQAKATFDPDIDRLTKAMTKSGKLEAPNATRVLSNEAIKGAIETKPEDKAPRPAQEPPKKRVIKAESQDPTFNRLLMAESGNRDFDSKGNVIKGPMTKYGRAEGAAQVLPSTQRDPGFGVAPAKNNSPEELRRVGRDYFQAMKKKYKNNTAHALVAYNWGPDNADKWIKQGANPKKLPEETRKYVAKILRG